LRGERVPWPNDHAVAVPRSGHPHEQDHDLRLEY